MKTMSRRNKVRIRRAIRWALPFVLSGVVSVFAAWGSIQFAKGTQAKEIETMRRDVDAARAEQAEFIRRDSFQIILTDIQEIKKDVRAIRYAGTSQESSP
jgi:hypothetical protein